MNEQIFPLNTDCNIKKAHFACCPDLVFEVAKVLLRRVYNTLYKGLHF